MKDFLQLNLPKRKKQLFDAFQGLSKSEIGKFVEEFDSDIVLDYRIEAQERFEALMSKELEQQQERFDALLSKEREQASKEAADLEGK